MATSGCDAHCDELDFSARLRFAETLPAEYAEIHQRRANAGTDDPPTPNGRPRKIRAVSLSGGGIRSATFNLGFLQALHAAGKLTTFDYLSTVSGGGYTGGWWSAWLSRKQMRPEVFPPPEDIETERDDLRAVMEERSRREDFERAQVKDSSLTAGIDPIHHLRLFSNFLTPKKGLLSSDTWRAIAVIGRNLVLTWLTLLPIVLAVIMLGQSFFALWPPTEKGFRWRPDLDRYVTSSRTSGPIRAEQPVPVNKDNDRDAGDLKTRLIWALLIPALLFVGSVVCVTLWMVAGRRCWAFRDKVVVILGGVGWVLLTWILTRISSIPVARPLLIALVAWFFIVGIILAVWQERHNALASDVDFWKNRIVNIQTSLLQYSVFVAVVLLFAAFGYEFVDFLLFNQTLSSRLAARLARTGGWTGVAAAAISSIYTAMKAAPRGGEDRPTRKATPPLLERIAFAIAPPLFVLAIGLGLAWVGHRLYTTVYQDQREQLWFAVIGSLISALLFLIFALYEFRPPQQWKSLIVVTIWLAISIGQYFLPLDFVQAHLVTIGAVASIVVAVGLALRAFVTRSLPVVVGAAAVAGVAVFLTLHFYRVSAAFMLQRSHIPQIVVGGILATLTLLIFELIAGRGANTRSLGLITVAFLILVLLGAGACAGRVAWQALTMVALISTILGWVLAFGWLADPNALTVHGFYKARLVRAYLGASNDRRHGTDADITDAVPGDDVMLVDLENTEHGAPYHLITTTLNLVGARDLATQQRFSDSFLMSKRFCGSFRTGFRPTEQYACGTLSLGTAVAVSGAAASPEMGAQTPSAALVALLTFFNVRLGYWAPTPNRAYWRSGSARLWPIYTLQELLSQTTDLLPFCYLTDGGHFDNSGVYTLIQRGCNFILYSDCGADPNTTLDDLGNLMRKVRIDFGTEIVIDDLENFRSTPPKSHFVTGKIYYSAEHAVSIGLSPEERVGTLVMVKPNRTVAGASADVQQYGWTNATYPQQSTADLWYDEAQFESYRKLGEISAAAAIAAGLI